MRNIPKFLRYYVALIVLIITCGVFYTMGLHKIRLGIPETQVAFKEQDNMSKTGWKGFHPVYVYVDSKPLIKPTIPSGPRAWYSQANQDKMILELMKATVKEKTSSTSVSSNKNFFVDLAAFEPHSLSNTYLLEKNGWEGLCIEPNPENWYDLATYRNCTIVGALVGGTEEDEGKVVDVKFGGDGAVAGIVDNNFDNKNRADAKRNIVWIGTILQEAEVPNIIDYFSLDVEGAETFVMAKFPWDKYKIRFMTIERPKDDLVKLLNEKGYQKLEKIADYGETIWVHESLVRSIEEARKIVKRLILKK